MDYYDTNQIYPSFFHLLHAFSHKGNTTLKGVKNGSQGMKKLTLFTYKAQIYIQYTNR